MRSVTFAEGNQRLNGHRQWTGNDCSRCGIQRTASAWIATRMEWGREYEKSPGIETGGKGAELQSRDCPADLLIGSFSSHFEFG